MDNNVENIIQNINFSMEMDFSRTEKEALLLADIDAFNGKYSETNRNIKKNNNYKIGNHTYNRTVNANHYKRA